MRLSAVAAHAGNGNNFSAITEASNSGDYGRPRATDLAIIGNNAQAGSGFGAGQNIVRNFGHYGSADGYNLAFIGNGTGANAGNNRVTNNGTNGSTLG